MDELKNPCAGCDHRHKDKKKKEPCASCLLPGQYNDELIKKQFMTMDFLRNSRPDNWGIKKPKNYKEDVQEPQRSTKGDKPMSNDAQKKEIVVSKILKQYCDQEDIKPDYVLQKNRDSEVAKARKIIARAMDQDGIHYTDIALHLKITKSTVWNYLNMVTVDQNEDLAALVLSGLSDTYKNLAEIAKEQERTPLLQMRFILKEYCNKENANA